LTYKNIGIYTNYFNGQDKAIITHGN